MSRPLLQLAAAVLLAQLVAQALLFLLMPAAAYGPESGTEVTDLLDVAAHPYPPQPPPHGAVLRYRRYLLPALASLLPAGARPGFLLVIAAGTTTIAVLLLVIDFRQAATEGQAMAGTALLVALPSLWASARHGMPDATLLMFLALGWLAVRRQRYGTGALLYGLACLTKETAAVVVIGEAVLLLHQRRLRPAAGLAFGAATFPVLLWLALALRWQAPFWYLNVIPGITADRFENFSLVGPLNVFWPAATPGNVAVIVVNVLLLALAATLAWQARRLPAIWWLGPVVALALLLWSDPVIYQGYLDRELFVVAWPLWIVVCRWCTTWRRWLPVLVLELAAGAEQALEQARYFAVHKELRDALLGLRGDAIMPGLVLVAAASLLIGAMILLRPSRAQR